MQGPADLTNWRRDDDFRADPTPMVVLDPTLVIRAMNPAAEQVLGQPLAALESRFVFEAFPANPDDPEGDEALAAVSTAMEQVLGDGQPRDLVIQRYDVPDPADLSQFLTRIWLPRFLPVWGPQSQAGVACRADLVQLPPRAEPGVRQLRDTLRQAVESDDLGAAELVEVLVGVLREHTAVATEVSQLREALVSRATIDQAKGVLMAQHRVSPEEAFRTLVKLSNDSNVRLADVAAAVLYQVVSAEEVG